MKIVTKKQLNLPQLIEWVWENEIKNTSFRRLNRRVFEYIWINENSDIEFNEDMLFKKDDIFEVETEEEITEDTVIPEMLTIYDGGISHLTNNKSLNDLIKTNLKSAYIMNDDLRLILIWRDGELIQD